MNLKRVFSLLILIFHEVLIRPVTDIPLTVNKTIWFDLIWFDLIWFDVVTDRNLQAGK